MIFTPTRLSGAWLIDIAPHRDERGFFARSWCRREFEAHGLEPETAQATRPLNLRRATLRGMHFQRPPHAEIKIARCTRGAIYDVLVDLRPASATFRAWEGFELTAENRRAVYIPRGFAH